MNSSLSEIRDSLYRNIYVHKRRQGMPERVASAHSHYLANLIVSRIERGVPMDMLHVGLDGFLKKVVKAVTKPFKQAGKLLSDLPEKAEHLVKAAIKLPAVVITAPAIPFSKKLQSKLFIPFLQEVSKGTGKDFPTAVSFIPGIGPVARGAIQAAFAVKDIYLAKLQMKEAERAFKSQLDTAYGIYLKEARESNVDPIDKSTFEGIITGKIQMAQPAQSTF